MKLLRQVIERKLLTFDENFINNKNKFWDLYQSINLADSLVPTNINKNIRNRLWLKILKDNAKSLLLMRTLVYSDRKNIYSFLSDLKEKEDKELKSGNLWSVGCFGITEFEYR